MQELPVATVDSYLPLEHLAGPVCLDGKWTDATQKVVSVLEILRTYASVYAEASFWLGFNVESVYNLTPDDPARQVILKNLKNLRAECARVKLEMTLTLLDEVIPLVEREGTANNLLHDMLVHVCADLQRELYLQFFVRIRPEQRKRFQTPFSGWQKIIKRFGAVSRDVEEMNKCFALCRYTAAIFHSLQVAELGAIELGDYIGVTDPKKGWGPTERKLRELVKAGHTALPAPLSGKFDFLEQMHREVESLTLAWRHKVDHAANRLVIIPNTDFTPDISEHIIGAMRIFMLRLVEGMP